MAAIGGLAILGGAALFGAWPMINVVETGRTPEYPDLQPRRYRADGSRVFDAALHAVNRLPRWTLISYEPESGEIRAEARTRMFGFVDDIRIRVAGQDGATVVSVRSASRIGRGDFGQNARNIRTFFDELDRQMEWESGHESTLSTHGRLSMGLVKLAEPTDVGELAFIKSLLDGNGIAYVVHNEHVSSLYPGVPFLTCSVMVEEAEVRRAETLLSKLTLRELEEGPRPA